MIDFPPEEVRLAESLVDEALRDFKGALPPGGLEELREFMIDELLCTTYGRARLQRLLKAEPENSR